MYHVFVVIATELKIKLRILKKNSYQKTYFELLFILFIFRYIYNVLLLGIFTGFHPVDKFVQ